ncbi:MAG: hypothetical protein Q4G49_04365 [Paracoccus sp. (in: a-proteobacteria)]|nr:hypothetical protein [Paracoccus sp. (in: a-proteobacteria)]
MRPPRRDSSAATVGIGSQNPSLERINGPALWAQMINGAVDQIKAAAFIRYDKTAECFLCFIDIISLRP